MPMPILIILLYLLASFGLKVTTPSVMNFVAINVTVSEPLGAASLNPLDHYKFVFCLPRGQYLTLS